MALSTQPYKGARDFYPEDKRLQKYMFGKLRQVAESFGYEEYDAPILEPLELYLAKTGEEIVTEQTYVFEDRGERKVVIRPEMTPTVSRMVAAKRQELAYPLRWYSIPNLWRYERPQKGRLREHWQLNVDIFGVAGIEAEYEIIQLADQIFKSFGAQADMYTIKLNSRKLMDHLLGEYLGFDDVQQLSIAKLIDRMHKISTADFATQLDALCSPSQREAGVDTKLQDILAAKQFQQLPDDLQQHPSVQQLQMVLTRLKDAGVTNAMFDITIMRGFDYYTDIVFEVVDNDPTNNRSMLGGGRYDGLVGLFGVEPVPTVGFGFGDVTLAEFLKGHNLLPQMPTETDLYIVFVGDSLQKSQKIIADLRGMAVNVAVDLSGKKLGDQFKSADKKGITYALVIGEKELAEERFTLKNLKSGTEEQHSLERIVSIVKDRRQQND
ncbi:MAG TPA: histidine--tRNA ligase [Candidatus Microsaccharimonas sp.]|nr:histidine--tRNA ligase [Candidatus Microsaccharimonas sp.]